jgi:hypothetical protein
MTHFPKSSRSKRGRLAARHDVANESQQAKVAIHNEPVERLARPGVPRASYTIGEFCQAHRISQSFYYKIKALGLGPRERHTLGKITISFEAAADWRNSQANDH